MFRTYTRTHLHIHFPESLLLLLLLFLFILFIFLFTLLFLSFIFRSFLDYLFFGWYGSCFAAQSIEMHSSRCYYCCWCYCQQDADGSGGGGAAVVVTSSFIHSFVHLLIQLATFKIFISTFCDPCARVAS